MPQIDKPSTTLACKWNPEERTENRKSFLPPRIVRMKKQHYGMYEGTHKN